MPGAWKCCRAIDSTEEVILTGYLGKRVHLDGGGDGGGDGRGGKGF